MNTKQCLNINTCFCNGRDQDHTLCCVIIDHRPATLEGLWLCRGKVCIMETSRTLGYNVLLLCIFIHVGFIFTKQALRPKGK